MDTSSLMKQILGKENLNTAYLQVVRNKGAEGVDDIDCVCVYGNIGKLRETEQRT